LLLFWAQLAFGQTSSFTRADTLRGMWSPERSCYDVTFYHLDVKIDPAQHSIAGSNTIAFEVVTAANRIQVDLFDNMNIEKIVLDGKTDLTFTREFNAVFIAFPKPLVKGRQHSIRIFYNGKPQVARRPPWDGGFTWTQDAAGNPWVVVTCQGTGASLWWPTKDHQADEPDSMMICIAVPKGLQNVSNGRLRRVEELPGGWTRYDWFVSYPLNNYNVTVNIGKYAHFSDVYTGGEKLTLDYYVLPENLEKAKEQFKVVKPMMEAFEKYFGPYPFQRDGYKLIECPHNGMEHQSAVAYGNRYLGGYVGRGTSEVGMKFDFIIVHESAHEWWGNSVTSKDIADMWIHESFGAYAEALFVEHVYGYREALSYINGKKQNVRNDTPIIGVYNVHHRGSGDMYDKGQLVLNTLRSVINNDSLWFDIVKSIAQKFKYQTTTAEEVFGLINQKTGQDFSYFFNQYFRGTAIPTLEVFLTKRGESLTARYRWKAEVQDFKMPVKVTVAENDYQFIHPTTSWQTMPLSPARPENFKIADELFYVDLTLNWTYLDPRLERTP
jgi:aminopeptidase N